MNANGLWTRAAITAAMSYLLPGGCLMTGCGPTSAEWLTGRIKPETSIKLNPITRSLSVKNTKDVEIEAEDISWTKHGGGIGRIAITDKSTPVIAEDAKWLEKTYELRRIEVDLHRQFGENAEKVLNGLGGILDKASGLITTGLARGGTDGQSMVSAGIALLQQAGPLTETLRALQGGDLTAIMQLIGRGTSSASPPAPPPPPAPAENPPAPTTQDASTNGG